MQTRRSFLKRAGLTAAGVAIAGTVDVDEVRRRLWPGWRAATLAEPNRELAKAVLWGERESPLSFYEKLNAGYRTFDSNDGVVVRSLVSNQSIPIPEGETERYITLRDNSFLMPGDLVELGGDDENVVQRASGSRPILGAVVKRGYQYSAGEEGREGWPVVTVQVGGLARVGYGEAGSASGKLYRLGEPLADSDPERRRVRVARPSRLG